MEVFGLGLKIQEQGAATVEATLKRLGGEIAKTALTVGSITKALQLFVRETAESQRVQAQLATALRSTNSVSGQTIDVLNEQATALMNVTAFGDEAIGSAQALLLTFTNIREVFPQATTAVLDLAQALQMDARSAALMLGKALNDPITGVTALRRAGVQLSDAQQQLIKDFLAVNDIASAQKIILQELQTQVGGSAAAYRNTLGGALVALQEAFGNLFEASEQTGASMTGTVNALTDMLNVLRGPIQFVFTNFTNGLVTIASLVGQVGLAIVRVLTSIGAAATTFLGAIGVLLPGIGDDVGRFIDDLNAKVADNDAYFAGLQDRLRNWRTEVVMGTTAANNLANALSNVASAEAARAGGVASAATLGASPSTIAFEREQFGAGRERRNRLLQGLITTKPLVLPPVFDPEASVERMRLGFRDYAVAVQEEATRLKTSVGDVLMRDLGVGLANALENGLAQGLEAAIMSGRISDLWKVLSQSFVSQIASMMVKVALTYIGFAKMIAAIQTFLIANPIAAVAAAAAMLAFAYANGGKGQSGTPTFAGGASGLMTGIGASGSLPSQQIIFGATSATTAAGMQPRQAMNVTIIGPNDPQAQRAMQELLAKANSRGRVG